MSAYRTICVALLLSLVAACSVPGPGGAPGGVHDPFETDNRRTHAFNKSLDKNALRGASKGYTAVVPEDVQILVNTFADTASLPKTVVNQVLQGRIEDALRNTLRFTTNVVLGFGGIFDVANDFGIEPDESDFGETLHVWGFQEGAYVELPILGPSTERDAVGEVVDMFTNPLSYVLPTTGRRVVTGAKVLETVGDRGKFSDTVDGILYDSADSYAQARLIYLQNRRFELGMDVPASEEIDPMALDTEGF